MFFRITVHLAACAAILTSGVHAADSSKTSPVGKKIANFELKDFQGAPHSLDGLRDKKVVVVVFLGTECPLAKLYGPKLAQWAKRFEKDGVAFLGIDSNQQDSLEEIAHYARTLKIDFPMLKDPANQVADQFGARRTPEAFVLDADRVVRYWGRIDDQYGVGHARTQANREELKEAVSQLLEGKPVAVAVAEPTGCLIGRARRPVQGASVTYSKQISRLFQKRCQECHRPGAIGPFSLLTYQDAFGWAEMIQEVVSQRRMPPWHANPDYGKFSNACRLADEEVQQIAQWVKDGAPEGNPQDLPRPIDFPDGWRIPKPDVFLKLPYPQPIPATGVVGYRHVAVETNFTEDKWVQFAEARADKASVVHHIIVFIRPPQGSGRRGGMGSIGLGQGWLTAAAPGSRPLMLEEGHAKFIPAGSKLIFQMHYTPNGLAVEDQSSIGLVFADPAKVKKKVITEDPGQFAFRIPPGADDYKMTATYFFRDHSRIISFSPHMHVRGKSFRYEAIYPDGNREILLDVPRYDFAWQDTYMLAEPKRMPAGSQLLCTAHYDNSENNLSNPDPTASVTWGEQTWEEMMFGFFDMVLEKQDLSKTQPDRPRAEIFLESLRHGAVDAEGKAAEAAKTALASPENFEAFSRAIVDAIPQVDRVCLISAADGQLTVKFADQDPTLRSKHAMAGFRRPATGFALPTFAAGDLVVFLNDLDQARGFDMGLMRGAFGSSVHVPVVVAGERCTLNFWSRDKNAFPKEAEPILRKFAALVAQSPVAAQAAR